MKKKVILLLDHAPDYREDFLRLLSDFYDLVVIAHSCETGKLIAPDTRIGYKYYELKTKVGVGKYYDREFISILRNEKPDLICVALNLRHPYRILSFLLHKSLRRKWFWWGQILGKSKSSIILMFKKSLINLSQGALTYSSKIVEDLRLNRVVSFNNSQFSKNSFIKLPNNLNNGLNCLFVGRPQERKQLELIFQLANLNSNCSFRLVGPGMKEYFSSFDLLDNISLYDGASGLDLVEHFRWCNLVINPGHVGLLVMNASCHNRAIIINSDVEHAPEIILAKESSQFLISFSDLEVVSNLLQDLIQNFELIEHKAEELFEYGQNFYSIDYMVSRHREVFDKFLKNESNNSSRG